MDAFLTEETEDLEADGCNITEEVNACIDPILDTMKSGGVLSGFTGVRLGHNGSYIDAGIKAAGLIGTYIREVRGRITEIIVPCAYFLDQLEGKLSERLLRHSLGDDVQDVFKRIITIEDNGKLDVGIRWITVGAGCQGIILRISKNLSLREMAWWLGG